jgi:hypothetical protein
VKFEIHRQVIPEDVAREQFQEAKTRWFDPRVPRSLGRHATIALVIVTGAGLAAWGAIRGNQDTLQDAIRPVVEEELPRYINDASTRIEGKIDQSLDEATEDLGERIDTKSEDLTDDVVTAITGGN